MDITEDEFDKAAEILERASTLARELAIEKFGHEPDFIDLYSFDEGSFSFSFHSYSRCSCCTDIDDDGTIHISYETFLDKSKWLLELEDQKKKAEKLRIKEAEKRREQQAKADKERRRIEFNRLKKEFDS